MTKRAIQSQLAAAEVAAFTAEASGRNQRTGEFARSRRESHLSPLALAYRPSRDRRAPNEPGRTQVE